MTVFPTAYFGNVNYYKAWVTCESKSIESKAFFEKQSLRTRCEILGPNGVQQLSIPVIRPNGSKTPMDQVIIANDTPWQKVHWKSIETAYASAAFFEDYGDEVRKLIFQKENHLLKFNQNIHETIFEWLGLSFQMEYNAFYDKDALTYVFGSETMKPYFQLFPIEGSFIPHLSILDLIFAEGPMARKWLMP